MVNIRLECEDGDYVASHTIRVENLPRIVSWNGRIFELHDEVTYREIEAYLIPQEEIKV